MRVARTKLRIACDPVNGRLAKQPSAATVSHLRELLEQAAKSEADVENAKAELYLAAFQACKVEGVGQQQLGDALGFGKSTVHGWVKRGEQLRANPPNGG